MIDLTQATSPTPAVHRVRQDPGLTWKKEPALAVDAPPDHDLRPAPEARWPAAALRTGLGGAVAPRVVRLVTGAYRLYYTQILPRPGNPTGANDYDQASARILSAISMDGMSWDPEPGVRLAPEQGGAGSFRVVSADVVPCTDASGRLRMYYECCPGAQTRQNSIRSAVSDDGLVWTPEPGVRLEQPGRNYKAPRILFLDDGRVRLYVTERGAGIISAISTDGGLSFALEPGFRVPGDATSFAPDIVGLPDGGYRIYYVSTATGQISIHGARSADGLNWQCESKPVIVPDGSGLAAAKCSEMCVVQLPGLVSEAARFHLLFEACDGTTPNQRGVWRIVSAASA